jgi:hypothetical protein
MNLRRFSAVAFVSALNLTLTGCATRIALYDGPQRPETQIALLPWDEAQEDIHLTRVDNRRISGSKPTVELLPGYHTLEVVYTPDKAVRSYPVQLRFRAEAGHSYVFSAKMLGGNVDGSGVWGGKYQVYVFDLIGAREVARSAGPGPSPTTAARAGD